MKKHPQSVYPQGQRVEVSVEIKDPNSGEPYDPPKVVCTVEDGDGSTSTPAVSNPQVGRFVAFTVFKEDGRGGYAFDAFDDEDEPLGTIEVEVRIRKQEVPR